MTNLPLDDPMHGSQASSVDDPWAYIRKGVKGSNALTVQRTATRAPRAASAIGARLVVGRGSGRLVAPHV